MIRNAPILVLDEASSGLDAASEKVVFEALDRLMKGKTSIVITHHLSTIRTADVIFVVDDGEIVERGNHAELLRKAGFTRSCMSCSSPVKSRRPPVDARFE